MDGVYVFVYMYMYMQQFVEDKKKTKHLASLTTTHLSHSLYKLPHSLTPAVV